MRRITTIEYSSALRLEAVTVHHLLGAERLGHEGADLAGRAARHRWEEAKPWLLKVAVNPSLVQVKLVDEVVLRIEVVLVVHVLL